MRRRRLTAGHASSPRPNHLACPRYRPKLLALAPSRARHAPRRPLLATTPRMAVAAPLLSPPLKSSISENEDNSEFPSPFIALEPVPDFPSSSAQSGSRRRHGRLPSSSPWSPYPGPPSFQTGHPATFPSLPGSSQARARLESATGALPPPCATTVGRLLPWSHRLRSSEPEPRPPSGSPRLPRAPPHFPRRREAPHRQNQAPEHLLCFSSHGRPQTIIETSAEVFLRSHRLR